MVCIQAEMKSDLTKKSPPEVKLETIAYFWYLMMILIAFCVLLYADMTIQQTFNKIFC